MIKKLGICGDSFMNGYGSEIHWSGQLSHFFDTLLEQVNLSIGGISNIAIASQVRNIVNYDCDAIVISFTEPGRFDIDLNPDQHIDCSVPPHLTCSNYANRWRGSTSSELSDVESKFRNLYHGLMSNDWLALQSYYVILSTLHFLTKLKINFAYSLGGFVIPNNFFNRFCIPNELLQFESNMIKTNLWHYPGETVLTGFHVYDQAYQKRFLDDAIKILNQHD